MKKHFQIILFVSTIILPLCLSAQNTNLAERLGYEQDAKLLIIHADDIGLAHSVNTATIKALKLSGISSASIWLKKTAG